MKKLFAYILILLIFGPGIYAVLRAGIKLKTDKGIAPVVEKVASTPAQPLEVRRENLRDPLSRLLLQIILIVLFARIIGHWLVKLGQPAVIGEMIAGIILGPSLVGMLFPNAFHFIFPDASLGVLRMLSHDRRVDLPALKTAKSRLHSRRSVGFDPIAGLTTLL